MADYKSDIEIAQEATMLPIEEVAKKANIDWSTCEPYGHYKAKVDIHSYKDKPMKAKLILVTEHRLVHVRALWPLQGQGGHPLLQG